MSRPSSLPGMHLITDDRHIHKGAQVALKGA
jgi:hypothetical protein